MTQKHTLPTCPRCHKTVETAEAAFCPFCGAPVRQTEHAVADGARKLLDQADKAKDPVKKYAILMEAEKQYPDELEVAEAILFHGRLHERSPRKLDFTVIKCYLWHMYLTPRDFTEEQKNAMREELVAHPQLQRCLSLAPDRQAYMRRYLEKLGAEFVSLFMKGSNRYNQSILGFRLDSRMDRVLAEPTAFMMENIRRDTALDAEQREMVYDAIYRAFLMETGGETRWVDEHLTKRGCPVPVRL